MKHLRSSILTLLTAALLLSSIPATAMTAAEDSTLATAGWTSGLIPWLLDGLAWAVPVVRSEGASTEGVLPPPTGEPTDSPVWSTPTPDGSSNTESGHLIDPNG